ncbi:putative toxin-antitoxin system toxin component, PIN family [Trichormus variabilis]|uniref:Putative toxin-antitoxin system toxin component, PIN family n=1 Tax=Trichormus variabilis SAG 1403-4b TaxID=447716 RepID=A0A3S1CSQ4_ANAVA|nr:putative toxin-antitoxin system toxin component, PIN family [Trichormus variabilis]MBD2627431.1 putative toxin-antitoxin system toxin component, PIN family [Trichormus variabilis FACHB-164]RUS97656.1 putative toxin-antitoxin system toxin component, PIN family [Trichormus variabilis SAG 1403-4b]
MMNERRFVFDTNVLVSAFLFSQSKPRQALDKSQDIGIILLSDSVFTEAQEVLSRPKFDRYITLARRKDFLEILAETAEFINITEQVNECRDPKDNKYLELAVSGKAECIITGDEDLLILHPFRQIDILTVQNFLDKINIC